jgi:hypothetical protein
MSVCFELTPLDLTCDDYSINDSSSETREKSEQLVEAGCHACWMLFTFSDITSLFLCNIKIKTTDQEENNLFHKITQLHNILLNR